MLLPCGHCSGDVTQTQPEHFPCSSHHPHGAFWTPWVLPVFCLCQKSSPFWNKMELKWLCCSLNPGEKWSSA